MERYADKSGDSGVTAFEIGVDFIIVVFKSSTSPYKYTYATAGSAAIETMKQLARAGQGLQTYINTHKPGFER